MGIIVHNYSNPNNGISLYRLSVSNIYHIAKYLQKNQQSIELLILEFLEQVSLLDSRMEFTLISRKVLDNWLDNTKTLDQIIPSSILS
ncbi:hypothetical protein DV872_25615 [Oceanispirochaeta sp. M1]|nr:hypothetical protein DV872_25615 [Oceanispirochaeta sp. M1]